MVIVMISYPVDKIKKEKKKTNHHLYNPRKREGWKTNVQRRI